jgi:uncharacterized protein
MYKSIKKTQMENKMKQLKIIIAACLMMLGQACTVTKQNEQSKRAEEMKQITTDGFTTFKVSDNISMYKVTFKNQYNMNVAGHLLCPRI